MFPRSADAGRFKSSDAWATSENSELFLYNRTREILYGLGKPVCPALLDKHVGSLFLCTLIKLGVLGFWGCPAVIPTPRRHSAGCN